MTETQSRNTFVAIGGSVLAHVGFAVVLLLLGRALAAQGELSRQMAISAETSQAAEEEELLIEFVEAPPEEGVVPEKAPEPDKSTPEAAKTPDVTTAAAVPPAAAQTGIHFLDTQGMKEATDALPADQAKFISDRNTRAASSGPASPANPLGDPTMPAQAGVADSVINMRNKAFVAGEAVKGERQKQGLGAAATPTQETPPPPPQQPPPPVLAETPPPPDQDNGSEAAPDTTPAEPKPAMALREPALPTPRPLEMPRPQEQITPDQTLTGTAGQEKGTSETVVQGFTLKNKLAGGASTQGDASVDAADSPQGRYSGRASDAVQKLFQPTYARLKAKLTPGRVSVNFDINAKGEPSNLVIPDSTKIPIMNQEVALDSVIRTKFPPMSAELRGYQIDGKLNLTIHFTFPE